MPRRSRIAASADGQGFVAGRREWRAPVGHRMQGHVDSRSLRMAGATRKGPTGRMLSASRLGCPDRGRRPLRLRRRPRRTVEIGPLRLPIARPRSAEELIDEDEYARDERLPYWAELWPSALVLAERLARARPGGPPAWWSSAAAWALPAVAAALGGAPTCSPPTGTRDALAFTRANAAASGARVETLLVDWNDPPAELVDRPPAGPRRSGRTSLYEERNGPGARRPPAPHRRAGRRGR